jgi:hypothetical protein
MAAKWWKDLVEHLKQFAPTLLGAAGTVAGGPVAGAALAAVARAIAGKGEDADLDDVASAILGSPELRVKMEEIALQRELAHLDIEKATMDAETARLETVNATMRSEAGADDAWTRRWRPFWGYMSAVAFFVQVVSVAYVMFVGGDASLLNALGSLSVFWTVPLAVLGVSAWSRGQEKLLRIEAATGVQRKRIVVPKLTRPD